MSRQPMVHARRDNARLLLRVRRMQGQVEALERLLRDQRDCNDVLQQIAAVRGAATGLMADVLEEHLQEHLSRPSSSALQRAEDLKELAHIVKRYLK
ncbi:MAG TPA: metal/formaldehyde-sensitive transcriptional repressor [Steroidobacteraceae bacterium]|nr:metal/formaldehyde-sensitive transcriptional repressor [Steroidobacteraceae bacterium]